VGDSMGRTTNTILSREIKETKGNQKKILDFQKVFKRGQAI
jgi:hypothetical protein